MTTLTHSPADIVRYMLIAGGLGTLPTAKLLWPIQAWQEPDQPDNCVTLYDTSGVVGGRTQNDGEVQQHEGVQVRVRCAVASDGNTKIRQILDYVDKHVLNKVVTCPNVVGTGQSTYKIHNISRPGTVLSLGKDTPVTKRALFTCNMIVSISQLS